MPSRLILHPLEPYWKSLQFSSSTDSTGLGCLTILPGFLRTYLRGDTATESDPPTIIVASLTTPTFFLDRHPLADRRCSGSPTASALTLVKCPGRFPRDHSQKWSVDWLGATSELETFWALLTISSQHGSHVVFPATCVCIGATTVVLRCCLRLCATSLTFLQLANFNNIIKSRTATSAPNKHQHPAS